jgi:hypothetical protein
VTLAARASRLALLVHAVEDAGALCGAAPRPSWRGTTLIPVNCPRCLLEMHRERFAVCGVPGPSTEDRLHIREVGPEGVRMRGRAIARTTLCGLPAGWDVAELEPRHLKDERMHEACRRRYEVGRADGH